MSGQSDVRVFAVVNWRRGSVHGVTCDQGQAQAWVREIAAEYGGDPDAATMTVDMVTPPGGEAHHA